MASLARLLAVLKLSPKVLLMAGQAHAIVLALTNNAHFPTIATLLAQLVTHLAALDDALALPKGKGVAATRKAARLLVLADLQQIVAVVQAAADTNPPLAAVIIESAGMTVKTFTARQKRVFSATWGTVSGVVHLVAALAGADACFHWQSSVDQHTWTDLTPTTQASTTVTGLTPATTYYFRYRAVTPKGWTDWSQTISIMAR